MAATQYKVGDKALVKSTGIEVSISQVSKHGFAIVRFDCGYERMMLLNQLQAHSEVANVILATRAA